MQRGRDDHISISISWLVEKMRIVKKRGEYNVARKHFDIFLQIPVGGVGVPIFVLHVTCLRGRFDQLPHHGLDQVCQTN